MSVQKQQRALPHLTEPHDSLRLGIQNLKDKAYVNHPVEAITSTCKAVYCFCAVPRETGGLQDADAEKLVRECFASKNTARQADPVKVRCCSLQTLLRSYMTVQ